MSADVIPELSVVIATHERRGRLHRCLEALAAQTEDPARFEVVVAVDGSTDGTAAMVRALSFPYELRLLELPQGGKAKAVNAAMEEARGETLLFIDDDIIAEPEMVAEHARLHRENPAAVGIGAITQRPPKAHDWYAHAYADEWNGRYGEMSRRRADWTDCYGANLSVPRRVALEVGGIDTDLVAVEDIEFGYRLSAAGCEPVFLPAARGIHDDEKLRRGMIDDNWRFGRFCADFCEEHPEARAKLLGWFFDTSPREVLIRRILLGMRMKPPWLALLGVAIPGRSRRLVWFGFVSRFCFWSGARHQMSRRRWRETVRGVPVLMYHAFTDSDEEDRYVLSRRRFAAQLRLLRLLRYEVIPFSRLARALRAGEILPPRAAVITVDDGYADNLRLALPLLRRRRLPATFFLVSRRLGAENDWDTVGAVARRPLMSEAEVETMREAGAELGAHTRSHASLPDLDDEQLDAEVTGSRSDLERELGLEVDSFAYPYGRFDERAVSAAREAGYAGACTVEGRAANIGDDPLQIPRIEVKGEDSSLRFLKKLWFGGN